MTTMLEAAKNKLAEARGHIAAMSEASQPARYALEALEAAVRALILQVESIERRLP